MAHFIFQLSTNNVKLPILLITLDVCMRMCRHDNRHNIHRGPIKCKAEAPSIQMTYQEKKQLKQDIDKLPIDKLRKLVRIIHARESCFQDSAPEEIEVDFKMLKMSTLRALQRFVATCLKKCNKSGSSK